MIFSTYHILVISTSISGLLGWAGTFFYLLAYLLLSLRKLSANSITYHVMNMLGGLGMIVHAIFLNDRPNIIVNLVWAAIAVLAIFLIVLKPNKTSGCK